MSKIIFSECVCNLYPYSTSKNKKFCVHISLVLCKQNMRALVLAMSDIQIFLPECWWWNEEEHERNILDMHIIDTDIYN